MAVRPGFTSYLQIVLTRRNESGAQICVRQELFDPGVFQTGLHMPAGDRTVQEIFFQLCGIRSAEQGKSGMSGFPVAKTAACCRT